MKKDPRKEKVIYIAAGMLFILLAAALMVLLLLTSGDDRYAADRKGQGAGETCGPCYV